MIIDAHHHLWNPARGDYGWMQGNDAVAAIRKPYAAHNLAPILARHGIGKTVLVQAAPSIEETEYMLGLADATEWIGKVVGWVDFGDRSHLRHIRRFAAHPKFAGLRPMIQDIPDPDWMLSPEIQWAYEAIIENDLTFDALGFPLHIEKFRALFERFPSMRVVIDHGMKPAIAQNGYDEWSRAIALLAENTSAFCKLSGLATEAGPSWSPQDLAPYIQHLLAVFGPSRLMWGSDWPVLELAGTYDGWMECARSLVPAAAQAEVFGATAARFYRL